MTQIEKVLFFQEVELFSSLSLEQLGQLARIVREIDASKGEMLFREKGLSESAYVIVEGKVALEANGERILISGEKQLVGTWALLDDEPMAVTATVIEDSRLLRIDREDFYDLLADHSEMMQNIFHILILRIRKLIESAGPGGEPGN